MSELKTYVEMKATNIKELESIVGIWLKRTFDDVNIEALPLKLTGIDANTQENGIYFSANISSEILHVPFKISARDSLVLGEILPRFISELLREYLWKRTGVPALIFGCNTINVLGILKQGLEEMK